MISTRHVILVVFIAQLATSFADMAVPLLAPVITESAGLAPEAVGYFSSLVAIGSLVFLVLGGDATRWIGAGRLLLWGTLVSGAALAVVASGAWPLFLLAALILGLSYGPNMPAASELLAATVPEQRRSLAFSIKQAGVPAAGALAGLILPLLAIALGWQSAILAAAIAVLLSGGLLAVLVARLPPPVTRARTARTGDFLSWKRLGSPIASLRLAPSLPGLAFSSAVLAAVQGSVLAFLVTYLVDQRGLNLAQAGSLFVVLQVIGIPGRILTGFLADRIGDTNRSLIILAVCSAVTIMLLPLVDPDRSIVALYTVIALMGSLIGSWNGLVLAEVARVTRQEDAGPATAAAGFFTFLGFILGPSIFAVAVAHLGYGASFWMLAMVGLTPILAVNSKSKPR